VIAKKVASGVPVVFLGVGAPVDLGLVKDPCFLPLDFNRFELLECRLACHRIAPF
jgi:hypothetical protein